MKERPASEGRSRMKRVTAVVCPVGKGVQESLVKLAGEWHFTLRERQALARKIFPPKEATQMSHDVKYIGYVELEIADILLSVHTGAPFGSVLLHTQNLPQRGALL